MPAMPEISNAGGGVDWWQAAAGVGLFLFGLHLVEQALRVFAGRGFKQFLRRNTSSPLRSIFTGTTATAILQSSSVVGLTVLAFVGAGLMTMRNALGVVIGSNLGTTLTGWLVVTFGFKLSLGAAALPLIAVGTLVLVTFQESSRRGAAGRIAAGAGFVLFGLGLMKSGVAELASGIDLARYQDLPLIAFLALGLVTTAIIQSSSAMMMIALSALHAGVVSLEQAAAVAIGADLGTTVTVLLGAARGSAAKKRVALAHVCFNLITDCIAFLLLGPLLFFLTSTLGLSDPMYVLVAFHSVFNAIGIAIFFPFLGQFARFLERRFTAEDEMAATRFVSKASTDLPDVALEALQNETAFLIQEATLLNRKALGAQMMAPNTHPGDSFVAQYGFDQGYGFIKRCEGEILEFASKLQRESLEKDLANRLNHLLMSVRNAVHSTKSVKDVRHDLKEFENSLSDHLVNFGVQLAGELTDFYGSFDQASVDAQEDIILESLLDLITMNNRLHDRLHEDAHRSAREDDVSDLEVSTLLNVNREVYTSNRALIFALKDLLLPPNKADEFMNLPGVG